MLSPDFNDLSIAEFSSCEQNPEPEMNLDSIEELVNFDCTTATDMADFFTGLTGGVETTGSQNQAPHPVFPAQAAAELKVGPTNTTRQGSTQGVSASLSTDMAQIDSLWDPSADLEDFLGAASNTVEPTKQGIGLGVFTHHNQAATEEPPTDPRLLDPVVLPMMVSQQPANHSGMETSALMPAWQQDDSAVTIDPTLTWGQDNQMDIPASSAPGWGLNNSQVIMSTSSVEGLGQGNNRVVVPTRSTSSTIGWRPIGQIVTPTSSAPGQRQHSNQVVAPTSSTQGWRPFNQVATPTSSAPGRRQHSNQVVAPTSTAPGRGQHNNQVVAPTSSTQGWRPFNQVAMPTSSTPGWGQSNDQAAMPTNPAPTSSGRHVHVPTETLSHEQSKAIGKRPAVYPSRKGYLALSRPPRTWGPSQAPHLFSYTKHGEWTPGHIFDTSDLVWYITNARRLAKRPLRIWIQSSPSQYSTRYPNKYSTKCRWTGCPVRKNTIVKGFYRVAFDERPQQSGTVTNPFHNAGYMHLHCFEKIFDLFEIVHCGIVAMDVRTFPHENGNEMAMGPHQAHLLQAYRKWYRTHTAAYSHFDNLRDKTRKRGRHIPNEERLWSVLTRMMVKVETKLRGGRAMSYQYGNALPNHLGDLDEHVRLCSLGMATKHLRRKEKRGAAEMDDVELSTADSNGPQAKRAYYGSATTEAPSPALSHITVRVGVAEEEQWAACDAQAPGTPGLQQPWDEELCEMEMFGFAI